MADEAIYRCINDACGRPAPRRVAFCPWCGTAQSRAGMRDAAAAATAASAVAGAGAAAAPATPAVPPSVPPAVPPTVSPTVPPAPRPDPVPPPAGAQAQPAAAPSATGFGHSAQAQGQGAAPAQEVPRPPLAAHPPQRQPIRLRWWLLALALLWGLWLVAKPSAKKIDRQIDAAIALARDCKGSEAQSELIALRKSRATPEQMQRLQQALNDEAAKCTRKRQRAKAWSEAGAAIESALAASGADKARARLQAFTKRWGEDDDTRALKSRIEEARREEEAHRTHPLAAPEGPAAGPSIGSPPGSPPASSMGSSMGGAVGSGDGRSQRAAAESARNLIQSAERDLDRGDYGAAVDKMSLCLSMVDPGNRECRALKTQAEQQGRYQ